MPASENGTFGKKKPYMINKQLKEVIENSKTN